MKAITLTNSPLTYALVDDEDYERINKQQWRLIIKRNTSYAETGQPPNRIYMHQLVLDNQTEEGKTIDHKDQNGLNNQKENLRWATRAEQAANGRQRSNTFGWRGVYFDARINRWRAQITINNKSKYLGQFSTPEEAAKCYDKATIALHGEFATTNFPRECYV